MGQDGASERGGDAHFWLELDSNPKDHGCALYGTAEGPIISVFIMFVVACFWSLQLGKSLLHFTFINRYACRFYYNTCTVQYTCTVVQRNTALQRALIVVAHGQK